jgi:hypothetical protein
VGRNFTFQPLRGVQANLQQAMPLALGEMYFSTDTGNLFFGTPGVGCGYIQLGDTAKVNETLLQLLLEIRAMRLAMVKIACEGGNAVPSDFDPQHLATDAELGVDQL